jgi:hypothetical protein
MWCLSMSFACNPRGYKTCGRGRIKKPLVSS